MTIPMVGNGTDDESIEALAVLREELVPPRSTVDGASSYVTGMTAGPEDFNAQMSGSAPIVFAFVLGLAFLLLMVTFRSIVIPFKAIALDLLSVAAAYGVLVWVSRTKWSRAGFQSNGGIVSWLPLFCSSSCSDCRWTTTCSFSAGSARRSTVAWRRATRSPTGSRRPRAWSKRRGRDDRRVSVFATLGASTSSRWALDWR